MERSKQRPPAENAPSEEESLPPLVEPEVDSSKGERTPLEVERSRSEAGVRCPYCHDAVEDGSLSSQCRSCNTVHHLTCFAEHRAQVDNTELKL